MIFQSVAASRRRAAKHSPWAFPAVLKRLGRLRFGPTGSNPGGDEDGYLLVLAAEQEIVAGRDEQAQSLVNAAYAVFDRRTGNK
jgi:hypothetical protein